MTKSDTTNIVSIFAEVKHKFQIGRIASPYVCDALYRNAFVYVQM